MPAVFSKTIDSKSRRRLQNLADRLNIYKTEITVRQNDKGYTITGQFGLVKYDGKFLGDNFRAASMALEKMFA